MTADRAVPGRRGAHGRQRRCCSTGPLAAEEGYDSSGHPEPSPKLQGLRHFYSSCSKEGKGKKKKHVQKEITTEMVFLIYPNPWTSCVCSDPTVISPASTLHDAPDRLFTGQRRRGLRLHRSFLPKERDATGLQQLVRNGPFGKVMSLLLL